MSVGRADAFHLLPERAACRARTAAKISPGCRWRGSEGWRYLPATFIVALEREFWSRSAAPTSAIVTAGWAAAILIPLAFAWVFRRTAAWMNAVAAVWVIGLSAIADQRMEIGMYAWCAIGSAGMIAWGIYEFRRRAHQSRHGRIRHHDRRFLLLERDG